MEICSASSSGKYHFLLGIRKASGNRVEDWAHRFLAQSSDKGLPIQHLRPNIEPNYQYPILMSDNIWLERQIRIVFGIS